MLDPRVRLISVSGDLDLANQRGLRSALAEAAGDRSRELVLDLRAVTFLDSSALAVVLHAHHQFARQARAMACVVSPGPVQRLLQTSGLRDALLLCETPEQAASAVLNRRPRSSSSDRDPDRAAARRASGQP
jgi:anti-sigma B factor antagonist